MKRLIYIGVIVAILAVMIIPSLAGSYVNYVYDWEYFSYGSIGSPLHVVGYIYAYEQPYRQVSFYVRVYTEEIYRIFPAVELYSEPGPDQATTDVLGKYYLEEGILGEDTGWYIITLRQDEDSPAVFGRTLFGVAAGYGAGPWATVYNIQFYEDGRKPTITHDEGLSDGLRGQICLPEGEDPGGFY